MVFHIAYAKGAHMTPWHNLRYSSMASIIPAISGLLIFDSTLGSLYLSLSLFWPVMRCTVSSFTHVISQSKVHLHLWWNKKAASFNFYWSIAETYCPLLGIPLAFLPPGFLMTLQMSSTFLLVRTWSLSGLSSPCSLTSNLAASGLNPSQMYTSWSHLYPQDPHVHVPRHHPLVEGPILGHFHFCILCIGIHLVLEPLDYFWVLTPHCLHLDHNLLCLCLL